MRSASSRSAESALPPETSGGRSTSVEVGPTASSLDVAAFPLTMRRFKALWWDTARLATGSCLERGVVQTHSPEGAPVGAGREVSDLAYIRIPADTPAESGHHLPREAMVSCNNTRANGYKVGSVSSIAVPDHLVGRESVVAPNSFGVHAESGHWLRVLDDQT